VCHRSAAIPGVCEEKSDAAMKEVQPSMKKSDAAMRE